MDTKINDNITYFVFHKSWVFKSTIGSGLGSNDGTGNQNGSGLMPECEEEFTLTTSVTPDYAGTVSPASGDFESGTQVTLTAVASTDFEADERYVFNHWSGDASGASSTISFTMNSDMNVTAEFVQICDIAEPPVWCSNRCSEETHPVLKPVEVQEILQDIFNAGTANQSENHNQWYEKLVAITKSYDNGNVTYNSINIPFPSVSSCHMSGRPDMLSVYENYPGGFMAFNNEIYALIHLHPAPRGFQVGPPLPQPGENACLDHLRSINALLPGQNNFQHIGGISPADERIHDNFLDELGLNVPFVLIDPDHIEIRLENKEKLPLLDPCGYTNN